MEKKVKKTQIKIPVVREESFLPSYNTIYNI